MDNSKKELKKWIILILVFLIGFWIINNINETGKIIAYVVNILFPFILGGCLAFILNIPMTFFEKKLTRKKKKNGKEQNKRALRVVSMLLAITVIVLIITIVINSIVPRLMEVVNLLIDNIPYYIGEITKFASEHLEKNLPDINKMISDINIEEVKGQIIDIVPNLLSSSISLASSIVSGVATFFIASIFAIYILFDKEKLKVQMSKVLYAYLSKDKADRIINIGKISKDIFKNFFTVQCLEAAILGGLCILGMLILGIPYAISIGVLIGVTALIPVLGAFIGVIVGVILIVAIDPVKAIVFVIFVLILQQIEGNLIYPKVVGNSVGLPGIWVLFAVTVGGSLGGIVGMLVGVPVVTIIYVLLKNNVNNRIEEKE